MEQKDFYSVSDLQKIFSCSRKTVYKYLKEIPHVQLDGKYLVGVKDFDAWIKQKQSEGKKALNLERE